MSRLLDAIRQRDGNFSALFVNLGFRVDPKGPQEQLVPCHLHDDERPSLSANVEKGVFHCHACGAEGGVLKAAALSWNVTDDEARRRLLTEYKPLKSKGKMSAEECAAEHARTRVGLIWTNLTANDPRAKLAAANGWSVGALEAAEAGFLPATEKHPARVVLAVHDSTGTTIIGTKLRSMTPCPREFRTISHGKTGLIGANRLRERGARRVVVCAGEKDMLRGMTQAPEFVWVSHSGGEGAALSGYASLFASVDALLTYDRDESRVWVRAAELVKACSALRVVELPFGVNQTTAAGDVAKDVTDYFEEHDADEFRALLDGTAIVAAEDPRLAAPKKATAATAVAMREPAPAAGASSGEPLYTLDDVGNAERFVRDHRHAALFNSSAGSWLTWDGRRWARDLDQAVVRLAKRTVRTIREEAAACEDPQVQQQLWAHAKSSASSAKITAMLKLAEPELGVTVAELDADPLALNVLNGTLDLRTGELRAHRRENRITKLVNVSYDARATCPRFDKFLTEVFSTTEQVEFVRRAFGYTLTGLTREQVFFFLVGLGGNGKGTLLRAMRSVLGDYAVQASMESFLVQRADAGRAREDLAALAGARLVVASEVGEDRKLDEAIVKHLTGSDPMRARRLYQNSFEFQPAFKLWVDTNHLPRIHGTDEGIWRRIIPIEMPVAFRGERADKQLDDILKAEAAGILEWAVKGAMEWLREGLRVPEENEAARQRYRTTEDVVGAFIEDAAVLDPAWAVVAGPLYTYFRSWCEASGMEALSQKAFGSRLEQRRIIGGKDSNGDRIRKGLRLKSVPEANRHLLRQGQFRVPPGEPGLGSACGA